MAQVVRRLDGGRVEVTFAKPFSDDGKIGQALNALAEGGDAVLIRDHEGKISAVECGEKEYVKFLQSIDVSRAAIDNFRASLDDSKKAVRARQREPRRF